MTCVKKKSILFRMGYCIFCETSHLVYSNSLDDQSLVERCVKIEFGKKAREAFLLGKPSFISGCQIEVFQTSRGDLLAR